MTSKPLLKRVKNYVIAAGVATAISAGGIFYGNKAVDRYVESQLRSPEASALVNEAVTRRIQKEIPESIKDSLISQKSSTKAILGWLANQTGITEESKKYKDTLSRINEDIDDFVKYSIKNGQISVGIFERPEGLKKIDSSNYTFCLNYLNEPLVTFKLRKNSTGKYEVFDQKEVKGNGEKFLQGNVSYLLGDYQKNRIPKRFEALNSMTNKLESLHKKISKRK